MSLLVLGRRRSVSRLSLDNPGSLPALRLGTQLGTPLSGHANPELTHRISKSLRGKKMVSDSQHHQTYLCPISCVPAGYELICLSGPRLWHPGAACLLAWQDPCPRAAVDPRIVLSLAGPDVPQEEASPGSSSSARGPVDGLSEPALVLDRGSFSPAGFWHTLLQDRLC